MTYLETGSLSSSSDASSDLAPKLRDQFHTLSTVLNETNENLLSFEFMLKQSRQLARIRPFVLQEDVGQPGSSRGHLEQESTLPTAEQTEKLDRLLTDLNEAVGKVSELRQNFITTDRLVKIKCIY